MSHNRSTARRRGTRKTRSSVKNKILWALFWVAVLYLAVTDGLSAPGGP